MAAGDENLRGHVLVPAVHAGDAPAAPLLQVVGVHLLALYVAEVGHGDHALLLGNQVLDVHLAADGGNLRAALVGELAFHLQGLVLDNGQPAAFAGQNVQIVGDFLPQPCQLLFHLGPLQAGELSQTHLHNGLGLGIVQPEPLHQSLFAFGNGLGSPQNFDDLVDKVQSDHQAFQNVGPVLGLFQVKLGAAGDHFQLELDILLQDLPQGQHLGLSAHNGQQDHPEGALQLGVGKQPV